MCIIIAKPAGVKMPSSTILSNCFDNNPDGAGIMLSAKGKVYGFKGLMTFDAVEFQLKKLQKTFGSLDKLPVVLHFRIGTHGSNIAANTHPFPVSSSYKAMRRLEWTSTLGMAHNGIIHAMSSHQDIKRENVSDTMAFIKHIVHPIANVCNIMRNDKLLNAMLLASGSKLAFLDDKGTLRALGDFQVSDGVYYSNTSYKEARKITTSLGYNSSWYDWDWNDVRWDKYEATSTKRGDKPRLSATEEKYLRDGLAQDYGLMDVGDHVVIDCGDFKTAESYVAYAIDPSDGALYFWDDQDYNWEESSYSERYINIIVNGEPIYDA